MTKVKSSKKPLSPKAVADTIVRLQADEHGLSVKEYLRQRKTILKSQEEYKKTHWVSDLSNAQCYMIATTQEKEPYNYMGKPLSKDNVWRLKHYKSMNKGYQEWLKSIEHLNKLKDGIEKPFKPFHKLQEQMQEIGKRLRGTYLPEQEALLKLRKTLSPTLNLLDRPFPPPVNVADLTGTFTWKKDGRWHRDKVDKSHGLNTLMKKNKMKTALDIAPHFLSVFNNPSKSDYYVENYQNTVALAEACGVSPLKLFETLCIHLKVSRKHYEEQAIIGQGLAVEELINAWDTRKATNDKYTMATFYKSKARTDWSVKYNWDWNRYRRFAEQFPAWLKIFKARAERRAEREEGIADVMLNLKEENKFHMNKIN